MKTVFTKTTQGKIKACSALGLSYWADHPATGHVWAVDSQQKAHVVRWDSKFQLAAIVEVIGQPRKEIVWDKNGNRKYKLRYRTQAVGEYVKVAA